MAENITAQQFKDAARRAYEAGDVATARKLIARAKEAGAASTLPASPDDAPSKSALMDLLRQSPAGQGQAPQTSATPDFSDVVKGDPTPTSAVLDNVIGGYLPEMSTGEKIAALLNKGGESMTFGVVGDEADAALARALGGDYDERLEYMRANERQIEEENPYLAMGAELGGGILGAFLPGGAIGTLGRGAGLGTRMAASGAAGAGLGGLYGFMEGEGQQDRLDGLQTGALWGGGLGVAAPVAASGIKRTADAVMQRGPRRQALQSAQTAADLRARSGGQYSAFEGADAQISAPAMARLRGQVSRRINQAGAPQIPGPLGRTPKAGRAINKTLSEMDAQVQAAQAQGLNPAVPLKSLEDVRKQAGVLGREVNPIGRPTQGAYIAQQAIDEIDSFIDNLQPGDVPVGDAKAAVAALKKARELWRSAIKTQILENASDEADNYLSGKASGLRNQVKTLLRRNKKTKLFTKAEEDALRKVIGNNALGRGIRMLGDGLGAKMATLGGGMTGGITGAAIGKGASELASNIGDSMAERQMEIVKALISQGKLQSLPEMSGSTRNLIETLLRRSAVASTQ